MSEPKSDSKKEHRPARLLLRPRAQGEEQKRGFDRTTTKREVTVSPANGGDAAISGKLLDLSPTGLRLALSAGLDEGAPLIVEVLPDRNLNATVRWSRQEEDHHLVGCEWDQPLAYDEVWQIRSHL